MQALQNDKLSYHDYSVSGSSSQRYSDMPLKFYVCFHQFLLIIKKKSEAVGYKYLLQYKTHRLQPQNTNQNFYMA